MNFVLKICSILFLSKATVSSSSEKGDQFDITQLINTSLAAIFSHKVDARDIVNLIEGLKHHPSTYEIENTQALEPFLDKIYYRDIEIRHITNDPDMQVNRPTHSVISYNLTRNEVVIFVDKIYFKAYGLVSIEPQSKDIGTFRANLAYELFTLSAIWYGEKFSIRIDGTIIANNITILPIYDNTNLNSTNSSLDVQLVTEVDLRLLRPKPIVKTPNYVRALLAGRMKAFVPSMLVDNINRNQNFSHALSANLDTILQPRHQLLTQHVAPFYINPEQLAEDRHELYYYLIPTVSLGGFNFSQIRVKGLWNHNYFSRLVNTPEGANETKTTTSGYAEDIAGSMTWHHGIEDVPPIQMDFSAGRIFIRVHHQTREVNLNAVGYRISQTNPDFLTASEFETLSARSKIFFEAAVASAILPSMTNPAMQHLEENAINLNISARQWFTELYTAPPQISESDRPTDGRQENTTLMQSTARPYQKSEVDLGQSASSPSTLEENKNLTFQQDVLGQPCRILFPNTSIVVSFSKYFNVVDVIQREFMNNSKFTREVHMVLVGKSNSNDNETVPLLLNIHWNFTGLILEMSKTPGPIESSSYEFCIVSDQSIELELHPSVKNSTNETTNVGAESSTKEKDDFMLLTEVKRRVYEHLKHRIHLPLDVIYARDRSMTLIDIYILRYIDYVLIRCSLKIKSIAIR